MNCKAKISAIKSLSKKLVRATTYASNNGITRRTVYNMIDDGRLCGVEIDGVTFVIK